MESESNFSTIEMDCENNSLQGRHRGAYAAGKSYGLEAKNLEDILRSKNLRSFQSPTDETRSAYSEEEKETL